MSMEKFLRGCRYSGDTPAKELAKGRPQATSSRAPSKRIAAGEAMDGISGKRSSMPSQALSRGRAEATRSGSNGRSLAVGKSMGSRSGARLSRELADGTALGRRSSNGGKEISSGKTEGRRGRYAEGGSTLKRNLGGGIPGLNAYAPKAPVDPRHRTNANPNMNPTNPANPFSSSPNSARNALPYIDRSRFAFGGGFAQGGDVNTDMRELKQARSRDEKLERVGHKNGGRTRREHHLMGEMVGQPQPAPQQPQNMRNKQWGSMQEMQDHYAQRQKNNQVQDRQLQAQGNRQAQENQNYIANRKNQKADARNRYNLDTQAHQDKVDTGDWEWDKKLNIAVPKNKDNQFEGVTNALPFLKPLMNPIESMGKAADSIGHGDFDGAYNHAVSAGTGAMNTIKDPVSAAKQGAMDTADRYGVPQEALSKVYNAAKTGLNYADKGLGYTKGFAPNATAKAQNFVNKARGVTNQVDKALGFKKGGHISAKSMVKDLHSPLEKEPQLKRLRATRKSVQESEPRRFLSAGGSMKAMFEKKHGSQSSEPHMKRLGATKANTRAGLPHRTGRK